MIILGLPFAILEGSFFAADAIVFGWGMLLAAPVVGYTISEITTHEILEANKKIEAYNHSIDRAVWVAQQYGPSKADHLLLLDRQFTYSLLYDAMNGSEGTLKASLENFDPVLLKLKLRDQEDLSSINKKLKVLAQSKTYCSQGLPSAVDLGMLTGTSYMKLNRH